MDVMEMEEGVMEAQVEGPREKLRQILEKNGDSILQDPDRVEGLLRDHCGSYRKEISALVGALNERVPVELKGSWQSAMSPEAMRARMVKRMEDNRGLAPNVAEWAVDTWSYALGIGLGRRSDRVDSVVLDEDQFKKDGPGDGSKGGAQGLAGGLAGGLTGEQLSKEEQRRKAIESDRPGGAAALAGAGLLATAEGKKKAGIGAGALALAAVAGVYALSHRPTPPPPKPPDPIKVVVAPPKKDEPKIEEPKHDEGPVIPPPIVVTAISAGTPISIRLNQGIRSDETKPGATFTATLAAPLMVNGKTVMPVGTDATLRVSSIDNGFRFTGRTTMVLTLTQLEANGKTYKVASDGVDILAPQQQVVAAERTGVGAAAGALGGFITGKILHHPKAGTAVGAVGGGTVGAATTKPQPAKAKPEQLLHFKLMKALSVIG